MTLAVALMLALVAALSSTTGAVWLYCRMAHYRTRLASQSAERESEQVRERDALQSARQSKEHLRRFYESGLVGMIYWNMDGRVTDANDRFLDMVGYSRHELESGQIDWQAMTPPEFRYLDERSVAELKATGSNRKPFEKVYLHKDGHRVPIILAGAMLDEERTRGVAFVLDITDRKRAEDALKESEEQYRLLYMESKDAIMVLSSEEGFLAGNPATLKMFGCRDEHDFAGRTPESLSPELQPDGVPSRAKAREMIREAQEYGSNFFEWTHKRLDDTEFPATVLLSRLEIGGKVVLQSTVRDITELKQAEAERRQAEAQRAALEADLRQAQKMEAVGRLAGGVAHDFNNLLTVIQGNATLALDHLPDGPAASYVRAVVEAGRAANDVTGQLLAFSRRQVIEPVALDVNAIVTAMGRMLQRLLGNRVRIETSLAPDLGVVKADPSQLEQLLMNLVVNARDAMPDGGQVRVETRNVSLDEAYAERHPYARPGDHVLLAVTDTGTGIDPLALEHVFEPFFTTKAAGSGTGLGLSTVYGIVKQNGGSIEVCTELNRGSTFKIFLPRVEGPPVALRQTGTHGELPRGDETLLLVEDDPDVAEVTRLMLEPQGYRLLTAASGEAAMKIAGDHASDIHLLVTDVVMPGISGPELAREVLAPRHARALRHGVHRDRDCPWRSARAASELPGQALLAPGVGLQGAFGARRGARLRYVTSTSAPFLVRLASYIAASAGRIHPSGEHGAGLS